MIKKTLLSLAAGALLTVLFSAAAPVAEAACQGYCADHLLKQGCEYDYAGCTIHYDANDQPYDAECFFVGACGELSD